MPTVALTCPQCGASDPSDADTHGVHRCAYCGVRYRVVAGAPTTIRHDPGLPHHPKAAPAALLSLGLLFALAIAAATFSEQTGGDPPRPAPLSVGPVESPPPATPVGQDAPEEVVPSATFEQHSVASSVGSSFYVLGMVTNTSSAPIGKVEVHVVLLDQAGEEVFADHGYSADDVLGPGQSGPIAILVSDPPAHHRFETSVKARTPMFSPEAANGLEVHPLGPTKDYGSWRFAGSVTNAGDQAANFVQVRITGWDADDHLVGLTHTYASGVEGVAPGETVRYTASHPIWADTPVRFETTVRGRVRK